MNVRRPCRRHTSSPILVEIGRGSYYGQCFRRQFHLAASFLALLGGAPLRFLFFAQILLKFFRSWEYDISILTDHLTTIGRMPPAPLRPSVIYRTEVIVIKINAGTISTALYRFWFVVWVSSWQGLYSRLQVNDASLIILARLCLTFHLNALMFSRPGGDNTARVVGNAAYRTVLPDKRYLPKVGGTMRHVGRANVQAAVGRHARIMRNPASYTLLSVNTRSVVAELSRSCIVRKHAC